MTDPDRSLLLLPGRRLERLREEIKDVRASQFRRLYEQGEWYRHQQPPAEHPMASITFFSFAAANLSLLYRLTGQEHYLDEARRWIFTAARYPHWGKAHMPDHDLDAGWLSYGLSLAYSWLRDDLAVDEREELEAKLLLQGRRLYDFAVESEGGWWSSSFWQNHNWICYAGLATAGFALRDEHPEARDWTKRAEQNFRSVLALLPEDGSNCEGVVYWRYGVPWIATYLDVLEQSTGIDLFAESPYLRETFWYRLFQAAPNLEEIVNHGDCHDRRSGHSVAFYYKLASKYRIPQAQWLARHVAERGFWREAYESGVRPGVMPEAFLELLWYDPTVPEEDPSTLPTQRYFPDLGLVVARSDWGPDATMVSFKASPGGGHKAWDRAQRFREEDGSDTLNAGHHHPDANSFVLISNDSFLAIDDGYANRKRAENHNLVLVDGQGFVNEDRYHVYKGLDHAHQARIRSHAAGAGYVHAIGESAAMYDPELAVTRVDRHLLFSPLGHTIVLDRLAADTDRRWTWLLHSDHPAERVGDRVHRIRKAKARLDVHHVLPGTLDADIGETEVFANPTASTPSLEIRRVQRTLRVESGPVGEATFLTVLDPRADVDEQHTEVTDLELADGYGVSIERGDEREIALFEVGAGVRTGEIDAAAEFAVVSTSARGKVFGLVAGSRLADGTDRLVVSQAADVFVTWTGFEVVVEVAAAAEVEIELTSPPPVVVGDGMEVRTATGGSVRFSCPAGRTRVSWTLG